MRSPNLTSLTDRLPLFRKHILSNQPYQSVSPIARRCHHNHINLPQCSPASEPHIHFRTSLTSTQPTSRHFSTTTLRPRAAPPSPPHNATPTPLATDTYHKLSDAYIENLVARLEELQEEREDVDVEYSAGVLTLAFPPAGTYVLNKQPPNRQIWLSSPVSGPKRYDWVEGEGEWVYLRDGSTLSELLEEEVGVRLEEG
ncbi:Mitochondrial chaperone Frataxin [Puttea exsequens]|nr:Mitochondrial chaperone Frataxin [Puttea exsequens]